MSSFAKLIKKSKFQRSFIFYKKVNFSLSLNFYKKVKSVHYISSLSDV